MYSAVNRRRTGFSETAGSGIGVPLPTPGPPGPAAAAVVAQYHIFLVLCKRMTHFYRDTAQVEIGARAGCRVSVLRNDSLPRTAVSFGAHGKRQRDVWHEIARWNGTERVEPILQVRAAALGDDDRLGRHLLARPGCPYVRRSTVTTAA